MKKTILAFSLCLLLGLVFYASSTSATFDFFKLGARNNFYKNRVFNPDNQLSKSKCANATGNPIINVSQKVENDVDSGKAGNFWAIDNYSRRIKVWATTAANTYCAVVTYDGQFYAIPMQVGPENDPVGEKIQSLIIGRMSGGRRATIVGALKATPDWSANGNVGTHNYGCDIVATNAATPPARVCTGLINWVEKYFDAGFTYADDWWGWQYKGGSHGTWINSQDGNSGNIL